MSYKTPFLVLLIISLFTFGSADLPLSNTDGGSPSIVNNNVSVITGDFMESCCDLNLNGPEPLVFERFYSSSERSDIFYGWRHNHDSELFLRYPEDTNEVEATYTNKDGRCAVYYGGCALDKKVSKLNYQEHSRKGYTNFGTGTLSARYNIKNSWVENGRSTPYKTKSANGTVSSFQGGGQKQGSANTTYLKLTDEQKSNGNRLKYEYKHGVLNVVKAIAPDNRTWYSWIQLDIPSEMNLKKSRQVALKSSDGQEVIYTLKPVNDDKIKYLLKNVRKSHGQSVHYEYDYCKKLTKKIMPGNRFLGVEYFPYSDKTHLRNGRVHKLTAPVGPDNQPVVIYEFAYDGVHDRYDELKFGLTYVLNAKKHLTLYGYNKDLRIDKVEKHKAAGGVYTRENFVWSNEGNLKAHYIQDQHEQIAALRVFDYDAQGNVLRDTFYGNLEGKPAHITLNSHSKPVHPQHTNGFSVAYTYSNDGRNLLLTENYPTGKGIEYGYDPHRDLMDRKFTLDHGKICLREFYTHDQYGLVEWTVVDDGTSSDKNSLEGVTQRKIIHTINQSIIPIGLPSQIDEYYFDFAKGHVVLFKSIKNYYTFHGKLVTTEIFDATGAFISRQDFSYDLHGNCLTETNALGTTITKTYNQNDELVTCALANLNKRYQYDFMGRLIKEEEIHDDGTHLTLTHEYDCLNLKVASIDPYGHKTSFEYDEFERLTKITYPLYIDPLGKAITPTVTKQYDLFGNVTENIDQLGNKISKTYNARGQPTRISYANGASETIRYNDDGTVRESVAKNGLTTKFYYDIFERVLRKEQYLPNGEFKSCTSSTYSSFNKLTDTDENGQTTYYSYFYNGLLKSVTKNNSLTEYEYDALQRLYKTKQWVNETSFSVKTHNFDLLNRVIAERIEDENGTLLHLEQYVYDQAGNKTEIITHQDGQLAVTRTVYNSHKQPIQITNPQGDSTYYSYKVDAFNKHGQRVLEITEINAIGVQTITQMNIFGKPEMITKKNKDGQLLAKKEIGYDAIGNVVFNIEKVVAEETVLREVITKWVYNEQNCLTHLIEAYGTKEQKTTEYLYNAFLEKTATIKQDGQSIHCTYNALGLLKSHYASNNSFSYTYEYDVKGQLITSVDLVNHQTTFCKYNSADQMIQETLGTGLVINYTYDYVGRPIKVTLPDASSIQYEYDPLHLKKATRFSKDNTEIFSHHYLQYDLNNSLLEEKNSSNFGSLKHSYDLNGQLVETNSPQFCESIVYNEIGCLVSFEIKNTLQDVKNTFSYDDLNQLKSEDGFVKHAYVHDSLNNCVIKDDFKQESNSLNQLLQTKDQTLTYDGNGNLAFDGSKSYAYDTLDRLIAVTFDDESYVYTYDSNNRRLSKTHKRDSQIVNETRYLYMGQNEVGSYDADNNLNEFRMLGTGKGAEIGATVLIEKNNAYYFPLHDHNGNIISLINADTLEVAESYRYSAFGEESIFNSLNEKTTDAINSWRFSSKRVDTETGFVNFGRRYYNTHTARWISPDPIGFEGGPNHYAYVMNSPLNHFDLYGLEAVSASNRSTFQSVGNYIRDAGRAIGRCIENVIHRTVTYAKNLFNSKSSQRIYYDDKYERGFTHQSLNIDLTHFGRPIHPKIGIGLSNGIMGVMHEAVLNAFNLSDIAGGINVTLSFNETHNPIRDSIEAGRNIHLYVGTRPVRLIQANWYQFFKNASDDAQYLHYCHSQGAAHTRNALMDFPEEYRSRIHVVAIAPAAYIRKGLCASVTHYVTDWDFVTYFDPLGRIACSDSIVKLKSHKDAPFHDHSFGSPTYEEPIRREMQKFIKKYGQ